MPAQLERLSGASSRIDGLDWNIIRRITEFADESIIPTEGLSPGMTLMTRPMSKTRLANRVDSMFGRSVR